MSHILLIQCSDRVGLIHNVTAILFAYELNVISNDEFVDPLTREFFMRMEFTGDVQIKELKDRVASVLPDDAQVRIESTEPKDILILAGREAHCLGDLLLRNYIRELNIKIQAVIGNHSNLEPLTSKFDIPFHHVPVHGLSREAHEGKVLSILRSYQPSWIVLAKYMRILTASLVSEFENRIINIHHSFLPAFVGAQPYRQAYNRGVKIIGATAHFVTTELDEGPIITQSVLPVNHSYTAEEMAREGEEIEKLVLSRALRHVTEKRVFVSGKRTIVFD
jgi:formyltetrahydrofolate deformylase